MSQHVEVNADGGLGFGGLLGIVFIVLKLTGVITWSWLWVLSPVWVPLGLFLLILVVSVAVAAFQ